MSIFVGWASRALKSFWDHGGTAAEQARQEGIVQSFATYNVPGVASAEILAPGHAGGSDPNEPWHITTRYFDAGNAQIQHPYGGAWHAYP